MHHLYPLIMIIQPLGTGKFRVAEVEYKAMKNPKLSLQTKLVLMMVALSATVMLSMSILYTQSEKRLISEVHSHTEELVKAIEVSVERLTTQGVTDEVRLGDYIKRLNKKGIEEISIIAKNEEIIASSDPNKIGSKASLSKKRKDLLIKATIGEERESADSQKTYNLIVPVVVGKEHLGYIHLIMRLDDFRGQIRVNYFLRLMITGIIFVIGIAAAVYMARRYIKPIEQVVAAAGMVASGNLDHHLPEGRMDEIGELTTSFNRMVDRLRETRELEERLRKAEHLSTVGQLASGIAHEIRNPLNLISLTIDYINKLLADPKSDEKDEISKRLANVKDEIRRLNGMVENFLNFGKLKKPELRPASVADLVDEVCVLSSSMMKDRKVEIEIRSDNHIPLLLIDREQLKSCLLNVVINAVQAMPGGGRIRLNIMQEGEPGNEQNVRISITDTGQGISPLELERIFEPYFTTKEAGIGLGLPLAKNLIEGHGGTIEVTSTVGAGTEVTLKLPIINALVETKN